jgi:RimJ/RimL family protein N-acetyltransferase
LNAPFRTETARLVLRRPERRDAAAIFAAYAGDAEVTRYLGWPRHHSVDDTRAFLDFSDAEWHRWPAGPYLVDDRATGALLGGTGFAFETPYRAATGYVFARAAWGRGYATEALEAVVALAPSLGLSRLYALCHPEHAASRRVLEKCGFAREGTLRRHQSFPNLESRGPEDALCFARVF